MADHKRANPSESRQISYELLRQVAEQNAYANLVMPRLLQSSSLDERDRGFATELAYGTLRMQGKYDAKLKRYIDRDFNRVDGRLLNILRMGMHEIFSMRTPEHAAVSQAVDLARKIVGESTGSFVNAVLRNALRDTQQQPYSSELERLYVEYSHPEWIVQSYFDIHKDWRRVEQILNANNVAVKPDLVSWQGLSSVAELTNNDEQVISGTRFGLTATLPPYQYAAVRERRAGVQDRGSQIVAEAFLHTAAGEGRELRWLDMCAGPGGKAAYIFHSLKTERPQDYFLANEISEHRAELVSQVIPKAHVHVGGGQNLQHFPVFDRILVDAPCSGLGALRRRPEARWRKTRDDLKNLVALQRDLLDSASALLSDSGIIAYVTCSPHLAETRLQVADFLHRKRSFEILSLASFIPEQVNHALSKDGSLQLWTDVDNSDAMFMVLFHRKDLHA